jgi:hypothetical protein
MTADQTHYLRWLPQAEGRGEGKYGRRDFWEEVLASKIPGILGNLPSVISRESHLERDKAMLV